MNSFRDIETAAKNINWYKDIKDIANPDDPICKNWLSYTAWMTDKLRNEFPQHTLKVTDDPLGNSTYVKRHQRKCCEPEA